MPGYDVQGALRDGVPAQDIAEHLADKHGYDLAQAQADGVPLVDILGYLANKPFNQQRYNEAHRPGFTGSFMDAASVIPSQAGAARAFAANPNAQTRKAFLDAGKSKYVPIEGTVGLDKTLGENWEAIKEGFGGSFGSFFAPVVAGTAAAEATALPVATAPLAPIAGVAAGAAVDHIQYLIANLQTQAKEQQDDIDAGRPPRDISVAKAALAAVPQAAIDFATEGMFGKVINKIPFVKNLLGGIGDKAASHAAGALEDAVQRGTLRTVGGGFVKGAGKGIAVEVPGEVAQQALQRWQAGQSLSSPEAMEEYRQAAVGALVLSIPMGGVGGVAEAHLHNRDVREAQEAKNRPPDLPGGTDTPEAYAKMLTEAGSFSPEEIDQYVKEAYPDWTGGTNAAGPVAGGSTTGVPPDAGAAGTGTTTPPPPPSDVGGVGPTGQAANGVDNSQTGGEPPLTESKPATLHDMLTQDYLAKGVPLEEAQAKAQADIDRDTDADEEFARQDAEKAAAATPTITPSEPVAPTIDFKSNETGDTLAKRKAVVREALKIPLSKWDELNVDLLNKATEMVAERLARKASTDTDLNATLNDVMAKLEKEHAEEFAKARAKKAAVDAQTAAATAETAPTPAPQDETPPVGPAEGTTVDQALTPDALSPGQVAADEAERRYRDRGDLQTSFYKGALGVERDAYDLAAAKRDEAHDFAYRAGEQFREEQATQAAPTAEAAAAPAEAAAAPAEAAAAPKVQKGKRVKVSPVEPAAVEETAQPEAEVGAAGAEEEATQPANIIDGVEVKQLPAGEAKGLKKPKATPIPKEIRDYKEEAGAPSQGQRAQQALMTAISHAYGKKLLSSDEVAELIDMLRPPERHPNGKVVKEDEHKLPIWRGIAKLTEAYHQATVRAREARGKLAQAKKLAPAFESPQLKAEIKALKTQLSAAGKAITAAKLELKTLMEKKKIKLNEGLAARTKVTDAEAAKVALQTKLAETNAALTQARERHRLHNISRFQDEVAEAEAAEKAANEAEDAAVIPIYAKIREHAVQKIADRMETLEDLHSLREQMIREGKSTAEVDQAIRDTTPQFSTAQTATEGMHAGEVMHALAKRGLLGHVTVLQTVGQLERVAPQRPAGYYNTVEGLFVPKTGKIYLVADNLASPERAVAAAYHELLGHKGLRNLFKQRLDEILIAMYNGNRAVQEETDAWIEKNKTEYKRYGRDLARAVDEVLARQAEEGKYTPPLWDKIVSLVKEFGRKVGEYFNLMGKKVEYSDGDVRAIIAKAHEAAYGEAYLSPGIAVASNKKTDPAAAASLHVAQEENSTAREKTIDSQNAYEATSGIGDMIGANGWDKVKDAWGANFDAIDTATLAQLNRIAPASYLVEQNEKKLPPLGRIATLVRKMNAARAALRRYFEKAVKVMQKFVAKHGQEVLSAVSHTARLTDVDPTLHVNLAAALTDDGVMKNLDARLADPLTSGQAKGGLTTQRNRRIKELTDVYKLWERLGQQPGGQQMFRDAREHYKRMYNLNRSILDAHIRSLELNKDSEKLLLSQVRQMMEEDDGNEREGYEGIPKAAFPKVYFPFRRNGEVYLRIGADIAGPQGRGFYTFDTRRQRNTFLRQEARRLGISKDHPSFEKGDNINDLRKELDNESLLIQEMFNTINSADIKDEASIKGLKDSLYQVYLMTMPERSIRRQFMHSGNVSGFSADFLRNFTNSVTQYANQIPKMQYANSIRREVEAAKAYAKTKGEEGLTSTEAQKLRMVAEEVGKRALQEIDPPLHGELVTNVNRLAFLSFLTSAATAVTQMTALPIRVFPALIRHHGVGSAMAMMTKYMAFWNTLGITEEMPDGSIHFTAPTVGESRKITGNPVFNRMFKSLRDNYAAFDNAASSILADRATPQSAGEGWAGRTWEKSMGAMTALFGASERISREMTGMMFAELKYRELIKAGVDPTAAEEQAVAHAAQHTLNTTGDYSNFARPGILRDWGEIGRFASLFKQYAVNTTRFFVTNSKQMFDKTLPAKERIGALLEMGGVLLMGGMFHGLAGMPLYSTIAAALDWLINPMIDALTGDDDEKRRKRILNPFTYNDSDWVFRHQTLPKYFGEPTFKGLDGQTHTLANVLINGPMSELSGSNIGSRTAFDGIWFRNPNPGRTWPETMTNFVSANIPGLSVWEGGVGGLEKMYDGDIERGLEQFLPGFVRGPLTMSRLISRGSRTLAEDTMVSAPKFNDFVLTGQFLGFQPTIIMKAQKERNTLKQARTRLQDEANNLMHRFNRAAATDHDSAEAQRVLGQMREFNRKYPGATLILTDKKIMDSYNTYVKERQSGVIGGLPMTKKEKPYLAPSMLEATQ